MTTIIDKLTVIFFSFWFIAHVSGHPEWIWKGIAYVQYHALKEAQKPWGCPSIFNKNACGNRKR
ncbi:MAG: hypothetical protein AB1540_17690 [Bdellovibrionota bacterium]